MPTRTAVVTRLDPRRVSVVWSNLQNTDTGSWVEATLLGFRHVQVTGTFGAGGAVSIEGSDEATPTNAFIVQDAFGVAITATAATGRAIEHAPRHLRPNVTAGDGTTGLVVSMIVLHPL